MKQDLGATVELHSRQAACSGGAHASGAEKDRLLSLKAEPALRSTPPLRLRRVQAVGGRNMGQHGAVGQKDRIAAREEVFLSQTLNTLDDVGPVSVVSPNLNKL